MSNRHLLLQGLTPLLLTFSVLTLPAFAQRVAGAQKNLRNQSDPRALDPADVYFQAWLTIRDAEKLEKAGEFNDARLKYKQAAGYYAVISRYHKNYNPKMVQGRIKSTQSAIIAIEAKAIEEIAKRDAKTEDLVEGGEDDPALGRAPVGAGHQRTPAQKPLVAKKPTTKKSVAPIKRQSPASAYNQAIQRGQQQQLETLKRDNERLRADLKRAKKATARGETAEQQRLIKKIADKDHEIMTIRNILARAPSQSDLDDLARKNRTLKSEIDQLNHNEQQPKKNQKASDIAKKSPVQKTPPPKPVRQSSIALYNQAIQRDQERKLATLKRDNERLNADLKRSKKTALKGETAEQQRLIKKIAAKDREITTIRDILARAPLQADMDKLVRKNRTLKTEIDITALSLRGTIDKLSQTEQQAKKYQEERDLALKRSKEIQQTMDTQKRIDNNVVSQLRKELKNVTQVLDDTRRELGKSKLVMSQLRRSLNQAKATIGELTQERDSLRTERDTLASILKKNDTEGTRKLITENMRLGKELKETTDRLQFLSKQHDVTKNELLDAKRDLAVAKTRIMRYQQDRIKHGKRILALESQLRDAESELASAQTDPANSASQEEIEVLKATVKRLIIAQDRRQNAEKILWETYQQSKKIIPGIVEAFDDIRKAKIELTEEEKGLMVRRRPDSEFTSPERVSPEHAKTYGSALERDIADHSRLVKRFYSKGRYEAARQILADMDEQFPGHFPTLMNRGVLELKTDHFLEAADIFNEAITMRENNSYAHYMLGLSYYQNQDFDAARNSFQQSLDLKPGNARAHFYLGNLAGVGHRYTQSETHFKEAIKLDPSMSEAYYNLSYLYLRQERKKDALNAYNQALSHGRKADPEHEKKLGL